MNKRNQAWRRGFHVFIMAITVFNLSFSGIIFAPINTAKAATSVFNDDFESYTAGDIITSPWSESGGVRVQSVDGDQAAELNSGSGDDSEERMWITADTTGLENIVLSYKRKLVSLEPNDNDRFRSQFQVDLGGFTTLESATDDSGWQTKTYNLPASASDTTALDIRFRLQGDNSNDTAYVDDVSITGDEIKPATIIAHKIVCDDESYLPNWGDNTPNVTISSSTAQDWVNNSQQHCWFQSDWDFQWVKNSQNYNPGDNTGEAPAPWSTFPTSTDANGMTSVEITNPSTSKIWVREVMQDGYIPFSSDVSPTEGWDDVSAEIYCHTDVINYDNWDWIADPKNGETYYCVAWNVAERPQMQEFGGYKWNDLNGDGQWDDEPTLEGWTITLWKDGNQIDSTQTDKNGWYHFSIIAGTYTVCEELQDGWTQTYPVDPNCHTVTVPTDQQEVSYNFGNHRSPETTIVATKIVCTDEADLPNWGDHKNDADARPFVTETTAADWVKEHESCHLEEGWDFEWAPTGWNTDDLMWPVWNNQQSGLTNPYDWNAFDGATGIDGTTTVDIELGEYHHVWVREIPKEGYIPFSGNAAMDDNGDAYSAELYCDWDVYNYDNYDYVDTRDVPQTAGMTHYCVAWNVPVEEPTSDVLASKVVCDAEAYLPNWGDNNPVNPNITATTAQDWVDASNGHCWLAEGWEFQWAPADAPNPGNDLYGEAGDPWTTFDAGVATPIPVTDQGVLTWFREVNQEGFIPFSGDNSDDYTAQFYCGSDVINNDNYDGIYNTTPDQTYYCVGWNTAIKQPTGSVQGKKFNDVNGSGTYDCIIPDVFNALIETGEEVSCEPTLSDWTIFIDENDNGVWDEGEQQTTTDENGWYSFGDLPYGTYTICEVQQDGWDQTAPMNDNNNCHTVTVPKYEEGDTCSVPVVDGLISTESNRLIPMCDFGNQESEYNIRVYKLVNPIDDESFHDPENWTWALDDETGIAGQDTRDVATDGTYIITETPDMFPASSYSSAWTCWYGEDYLAGSGTGRSFSTADLSVQPWNGAELYCEFANTELPTFDVTLTKSVDKTIAAPGDSLTYTLTWGVTGNTDVDIDLKDTIPTNTTFVSATDGGFLAEGEVRWDLGIKTPPTGGSVSFTVTISPNTPNGTQINNQATITGTVEGEETEVSLLDSVRSLLVNTANAADPIIKSVQSNLVVTTVQTPTVLGQTTTPKLAITKTVNVTFANPGDKPQYTLTVTNSGTGAVLGTTVTDTLPEGFTFGDGETKKTWTLGDLAAGESKVVMYTAVISDDAVAGNYVNVAQATATNTDPAQASATLEVRAPAVLGAEVLAETGIAARDIYLLLNGVLLVLIGAWLVWRTKQSAV